MTSVVGLDWLTFTGPESCLAAVVEWAKRRFGEAHTDQGGFNFYGRGMVWPRGPEVLSGHISGDSVCVMLRGSVLATFPADERVMFLRELLQLGLKCTRLDVAIDVFGELVQLVQRVRSSCESGELCRARRWKPIQDFSGRELVGQGVYIGIRGKDGSGRSTCVYDKGLEQGTAADRWHRFEERFADECAEQAAVLIAEREDWDLAAVEVALGAVDFRAANGCPHLADRPRVAWWESFIAGVSVLRVKATRRLPTFESFKAWYGRCVLPTLAAMAQRTATTVRSVQTELASMCGPVKEAAIERAVLRDVVEEFAELLKIGRTDRPGGRRRLRVQLC